MPKPLPDDLAGLLARFGEALAKLLRRVVMLERRAANTDEILAALKTQVDGLRRVVDLHHRAFEAMQHPPDKPAPPLSTAN